MVRLEIVEGLKAALARGSTLERAMMSFYNAGYTKEEVEEAARALHAASTASASSPVIKSEIKPAPATAKPLASAPKPKMPEKQIVSKYEEKTKPGGKAVTILLIMILIVLIGLLAAIFIFREELIKFFKGLF